MQFSTKRNVVLGLTGGLLVTGFGMATAQADASAAGAAANSPGIASGNNVQIPVSIPVNLCGNQIDVVGLLDSVAGNSCENGGGSAAGPAASAAGSADDSPGVLSGNNVQVPVSIPVNVCGNQVGVVSLLDSVHGNHCANTGSGSGTGASAAGGAQHSPGVGSGNNVQVPVSAPVNVCGNQVDVVGVLDSVVGNSCENGGPVGKPVPPTPPTPGCGCGGTHEHGPAVAGAGSLASTGSSAGMLLPLSGGLITGGELLRRKVGA